MKPASLVYSPEGERIALAALAREWTICVDLALVRRRLGEDPVPDLVAAQTVQDLALETLGADPWDWVQAMRAYVGAERWSTYWQAYAALPIGRALRLLRPAPATVVVLHGPGRSLPARALHRQLGMGPTRAA